LKIPLNKTLETTKRGNQEWTIREHNTEN